MDEIISPYRRLIFTIASSPFIIIEFISIFGCALSFIFYKRGLKNRKHIKFIQLKDLGENDGMGLDSDADMKKKNNTKKTTRAWIAFKTFLSLMIISVVGIAIMSVAFDYTQTALMVPLTCIILGIWWISILPSKHIAYEDLQELELFQEQSRRNFVSKILNTIKIKSKQRPKLFYGGLLGWICIPIISCLFSAGICVSYQPLDVTSRFTRYFQPSLCSGSAPCHVYLTYPENMMTSIIVNFQTEEVYFDAADKQPMVYYDTVSHDQISDDTTISSSYQYSIKPVTYIYESNDMNRGIHYAQLDNLQPNSTYYFRVGYGSNSAQYTTERKFRTYSTGGTIRFIAGGDIGLWQTSYDVTTLAGEQDPYFALIGGDVAYANSFPTCYRVWDKWLQMWETSMITTSGHMIPFIMAIGNHEAGGWGIPQEEVQFFFKYFAQQTNSNPDPNQRSSFHSHNITTNSAIMVLDTAHVAPVTGDQLNWLTQQLSTKYAGFSNTMAVYHVPMYPGASSLDMSPRSATLKKYWGPVFDQYNLNTAFENHDHTYARSKLLKGDKENANGTLYAGAGTWGVTPRAIHPDNEKYLAKWASTQFVYRVDLDEANKQMNFTVIDPSGSVIDQFTRFIN